LKEKNGTGILKITVIGAAPEIAGSPAISSLMPLCNTDPINIRSGWL